MKGGMIMSRMSKTIWIVVLAGMVIVLSGCYSCRSHWKAKGREVPPEVAYSVYWNKDCVPVPLAVPPPPIPSTSCGPYVVSRTYPSTEAPMIRLEKTMPDQVQVNAEFDYSIRVTNLAEVTVDDVKVTEDTEGNFKFNESDPPAEMQGNRLTWSVGTLAPGETRDIRESAKRAFVRCARTHCIARPSLFDTADWLRPSAAAKHRARSVLPIPGTPSTRAWPPARCSPRP